MQKSKTVIEAIDRINAENKEMAVEQGNLSAKREELRELVSEADSQFVELSDKLNQSSNSFNQNNILYEKIEFIKIIDILIKMSELGYLCKWRLAAQNAPRYRSRLFN